MDCCAHVAALSASPAAWGDARYCPCVFASETDIELRTATSPTKALEEAEQHDVDLVVTDQRMPEMTGLAFLGRLRQIRPDAHRILVTAYPDMEVALSAINDGMVSTVGPVSKVYPSISSTPARPPG